MVRKVFDDIQSGRYSPSLPEAQIVINKGHGVARTVPVFCIEDYIVYYFCIKELEDVLCGNRTENTFGGWTLGGKLRKLEDDDIELNTGFSCAKYSFNPRAWSAAYKEFNSLLYSQLDTGDFSHVLQFDLSNFYDTVRLDILERWIREGADGSLGWIVTLLFYFLNHWNRRNTDWHPQVVGIPMDALADCSRILANYYLQRYDEFAARTCDTAGAVYFRYADDQMILLRREERIDGIMLLLSRNLDKYGLRVNQKKVHFWTTEGLQGYRCREIHSIFAEVGSKKDKGRVRTFADAYLAIPEDALVNTLNGGLPLLNHVLWADIESLPRGLFDELFARYLTRNYLSLASHKELCRVHSPLCQYD